MTTTTHKSLRGPRAGMIFFRRDERDFETKVNNAVFPALQGGPHEHQIAALATQLKEVTTDEFKAYAKQVRANSKALAARLNELGYTLATGGTDNHLVLCDLRPQGVTGSKVELVCDAASITLNKNAVNGDRSAVSPGGIRLGTVGSEPRVDGPTPPHPHTHPSPAPPPSLRSPPAASRRTTSSALPTSLTALSRSVSGCRKRTASPCATSDPPFPPTRRSR